MRRAAGRGVGRGRLAEMVGLQALLRGHPGKHPPQHPDLPWPRGDGTGLFYSPPVLPCKLPRHKSIFKRESAGEGLFTTPLAL